MSLLSEKTYKLLVIVQTIMLFTMLSFAILSFFISELQTIVPYVLLGLGLPSISLVIVIALESAARMDKRDALNSDKESGDKNQ